jgi:membrane-associated phospholipid phosphatase
MLRVVHEKLNVAKQQRMKIADFSRQVAAAFIVMMMQAGVLGSVVTRDPIGIYFAVTLFVFGTLFNQVEKKIMKSTAGYYKLFQRPNKPECGCGDFDVQGTADHTFGMPSGHAQGVGFALGFWLTYIMQTFPDASTTRQLQIGSLVVIAFLICYSRIENGCHNWQQVVVGFIVGCILGQFAMSKYSTLNFKFF